MLDYNVSSEQAYATARLCLNDTLAGGLDALAFAECTTLLGPLVRFVMMAVVYSGAESMERRRNRGLAMTAAVLALLASGYLLLTSWIACITLDSPRGPRRGLPDRRSRARGGRRGSRA